MQSIKCQAEALKEPVDDFKYSGGVFLPCLYSSGQLTRSPAEHNGCTVSPQSRERARPCDRRDRGFQQASTSCSKCGDWCIYHKSMCILDVEPPPHVPGWPVPTEPPSTPCPFRLQCRLYLPACRGSLPTTQRLFNLCKPSSWPEQTLPARTHLGGMAGMRGCLAAMGKGASWVNFCLGTSFYQAEQVIENY